MDFDTVSRRRGARRVAAQPARGPLHATQLGYSLVEQVSVITIATVLMTVGVPSYRYVTSSSRVSAEVDSLRGDLEFARTEAVKKGQSVTVCPSVDGKTCSAGSQVWNTGWIVFSNPAESATVGPGSAILRVRPTFAPATDTFIPDPGTPAVTFNRMGFVSDLSNTTGGYITITLHTRPGNAQWTRCLQVSVVGMLTTERSGQGGCT